MFILFEMLVVWKQKKRECLLYIYITDAYLDGENPSMTRWIERKKYTPRY